MFSLVFASHSLDLRAALRKYRESGDRTKISNFFLFYQKNPFSELFSKITLKGPISLYFFCKLEKLKNSGFSPRKRS